MPNLTLPVIALLISGLLNFMYFSKARVKNIETKIYTFQLIINLIESFTASIIFLLCYTIYKNQISLLILIINKIDYVIILLWMWLLFIYILYVTIKKEKVKSIITKVSLTVNIIVALLIFILPLSGVNEGNNMNTFGMPTNIVSFFIAFYLVAIIVIMLSNIKKINNKKYYPIYLFILLIVASIFIRLVNPYFIFIPFVISFINLLMFFTIENPDLHILREIKLNNAQAEKANRAKSEFIASVSHEIRTPLNAIVAFSEEIIQEDSLEEAKEDAMQVIKSSKVLLETIGGILDISKIESGKMEISNTVYSTKELFDTVASLINIRMKEKGLKFNISIQSDIPPYLYGDKGNIQKILMNLLSNAYKYTKVGEVTFTVSCLNRNGICGLMMSIEDTGRGIKTENIDKLFTKFNRLDEDKNTTTEGTGLGLAITKTLVEMMNGKITIQSIYGSGSKFTVFLDQVIKAEGNIKNTASITLDIPELETDFSNKSILVVDDNAMNLKVADKLLKKYNANVVLSIGAEDTLTKINNGDKFDLLLIDIEMPVKNGSELLAELKSRGYKVPMVALTANATSGDKEKYIEEGFDEYIAKPIDRMELGRVLHMFLSEPGQVPEAEKHIDWSKVSSTTFDATSQINLDEINNIEQNYKEEK